MRNEEANAEKKAVNTLHLDRIQPDTCLVVKNLLEAIIRSYHDHVKNDKNTQAYFARIRSNQEGR